MFALGCAGIIVAAYVYDTAHMSAPRAVGFSLRGYSQAGNMERGAAITNGPI